MKTFYLYLDESGDFEKDKDDRDNPSLVGGLLSADKPIPDNLALEILGAQYIHSCEIPFNEYGSFAVEKLQKVVDLGLSLVIFENKDRLEVVDGDTTYLNVIAEGIIQLLQLLQAEYRDIHLDITVAVRKAINREDYKNRYIINKAEYNKRLQEKIIIGLARKSITSIGKANWTLDLETAREDHRLMLADIVCHTWFRKDQKFTEAEKKIVTGMYKEKFVFSMFSSESELRYQRMILDGNIGDVIYEIYTNDGKQSSRKYLDIALIKLKQLNEYSRELQLYNLFNKVMNLLYIDTNYWMVPKTITRIKGEFLPLLEANHILTASFAMDIYLLSLTIATHQGSIQLAEEDIKNCEKLLPLLVNKWESLDYYFIYKVRRAVHLINKYDINLCISEMEELELLIENTFALFPIADGLNKICDEMKSDIKGKVLGNRLQARFIYIKQDPTQLALARKESDLAIKEFTKKSDINRQYQYRCRIEYEAGFCKEALEWLVRSIEVDFEESNYEQLLNTVINMDKQFASYSLVHYISIIAEASLNKQNDLAKNMYRAWEKLKINEYLSSKDYDGHPYEIIYWKLATYLVNQGSVKAAIKHYARALSICNSSPDNQTLKAIALGIKAEKVSKLMEQRKYRQSELKHEIDDLVKTYFEFMNLKIPLTMTRHFMKWKPIIDNLKNDGDIHISEDLINLSRLIVY